MLAIILLRMIKEGNLQDPFNKFPPDGQLPNIHKNEFVRPTHNNAYSILDLQRSFIG